MPKSREVMSMIVNKIGEIHINRTSHFMSSHRSPRKAQLFIKPFIYPGPGMWSLSIVLWNWWPIAFLFNLSFNQLYCRLPWLELSCTLNILLHGKTSQWNLNLFCGHLPSYNYLCYRRNHNQNNPIHHSKRTVNLLWLLH